MMPELTDEWRGYYDYKLGQLREQLETVRQERRKKMAELQRSLDVLDGGTQAAIQMLEQQIAEITEILSDA